MIVNEDRLYRALGMVVALTNKRREGFSLPEDATVWADVIRNFAAIDEEDLIGLVAMVPDT
jgi:hypothetical protein